MSVGAAYVQQSVNDLRDRKPRRLTIGDETLIVRVRESARARTKRIIVGPRRPLEVIVPRRTGDAEVDALLEESAAGSNAKSQLHARSRRDRRNSDLSSLASSGSAGSRRLSSVATTAGQWPTLDDERVVIGGSDGDAAGAIERWYRREARRRIELVAAREAERLGLNFKSIAIRDPRTRWGSCSRRGNLSFSWRLAVAPPEVLEYVVVHELCHLREPSHQKPFWRFLESARPGWQEQARWLREHGQELHDYVPADALGRS